MLPLLLLALGAHSGAPPRSARATESVAAVEVSAALRFGWIYGTLRRDAVLQRVPVAPPPSHGGVSPRWLPIPPAADAFASERPNEGREVARAARWIDALPVKVDALDGGMVFAMRLRSN